MAAVVGALMLLLAQGALCYATDPGTAALESYVSEVDGSTQEYGIYAAKGPRPPDGYPLVIHGHGYGWSVSAGFSDFQRRWADEHGWLIVNCNGRGPTFYDGIGENDLLRVLQQVSLRYGVDRRRVYFTGGSMGATGALRHGVRHPDVFAAVVGVDGWSDYRLWHRHWYAREDMPDRIEEFRRPLLEAASPLFNAPTARTGNIGMVCDSADPVVWPDNSRLLQAALGFFKTSHPAEYNFEFVENIGFGHCAGGDLEDTYSYFQSRMLPEENRTVRCVSGQLKYGRVHWVQMDGFETQGLRGDLEAEAEGNVVEVRTDNLRVFTLFLAESPLAEQPTVEVVVDRWRCYRGPPRRVTFHATGGRPAWSTEGRLPTFGKTPELEGPIGHAFLKPFVVVYGTAGSGDETRQNREEAERFATDWNGMFVHGDAVRAVPDTAVTGEDVARKSLILFGTEESNGLVGAAARSGVLPLSVRRGSIAVRDPAGEREYTGPDYGVFFVYPNPLSGYRTYLVVSHGSYLRDEEGTERRGLGYDLEKLPWGWPDYVVFNGNRAELPYVANVNNKAATILYEAAYFVETGFFDQEWRLDRSVVLDWVQAQGGGKYNTMHVSELKLEPADRPAELKAKVRMVNGDDKPVAKARVTGSWSGLADDTISGVTGDDGWVELAPPAFEARDGVLRFGLLNVDATGPVYDYAADKVRSGHVAYGRAIDIAAAISFVPDEVRVGDVARIDVRLANLGTVACGASVRLSSDAGAVRPPRQDVGVPGSGSRLATFWLDLRRARPGPYWLAASAEVEGVDFDAANNSVRRRLVVLDAPTRAAAGAVR